MTQHRPLFTLILMVTVRVAGLITALVILAAIAPAQSGDTSGTTGQTSLTARAGGAPGVGALPSLAPPPGIEPSQTTTATEEMTSTSTALDYFLARRQQTWEERLDAFLYRHGVPEPYRAEWFKTFIAENSLFPIISHGGPIMYPLMLVSILAMGTVINRIFFMLGIVRHRDKRSLRRFYDLVAAGNLDGAISLSRKSKFYLLQTLGYALERRHLSLSTALIFAQEQQLKKFRQGIPILDTCITLSPLLGLLGTVTGMMASFSVIGGELSSPGAITGGIAEALIATAYGLGIAICGLLPFNYLNNTLERAETEIQAAASRLELILHPLLNPQGDDDTPPPQTPPKMLYQLSDPPAPTPPDKGTSV